MSPASAVITGVVVLLVGLIGLYFGARAHDATTAQVGLAVFAIAVAFEFWLLKRWFDYAEPEA